MSYGVAQRTREIGIRMALGARGGDVTSMVLRDAGKIAAIGLAIGIGAALLLTRFVAGMLYGVGQRDLPTFAGVVSLIAAGGARGESGSGDPRLARRSACRRCERTERRLRVSRTSRAG